jgi:hypothetical protein
MYNIILIKYYCPLHRPKTSMCGEGMTVTGHFSSDPGMNVLLKTEYIGTFS